MTRRVRVRRSRGAHGREAEARKLNSWAARTIRQIGHDLRQLRTCQAECVKLRSAEVDKVNGFTETLIRALDALVGVRVDVGAV